MLNLSQPDRCERKGCSSPSWGALLITISEATRKGGLKVFVTEQFVMCLHVS